NKIMHHKFMIIDGPRRELERAATATLVTGSANWSDAAATRYDENTLFLQGHAVLLLRMQGEFNLLWEHSRDFVGNHELSFDPSELVIGAQDNVVLDADHVLISYAHFDIRSET